MTKLKKVFCFAFLLVFFCGGILFSADRYALVIGNGNYRDQNVSALVNPINDAIDVAQSLQGLGYDVSLMIDVGLMDMMNAVRSFSQDLKKNHDNEGFFWFAGHGLSVRGIHYLLPVDVNPADESIIARGSFSVDDLMEEIGNAGNVTNLVVIDACRNNLLPTGRSIGGRGLTVLAADDYRVSMNKIVYSTMAGRVASDGIPGSRNSPFAEAFISKMSSQETFDNAFIDIRNETLRLTNGEQQPYAMGSFAVKDYSLNPSGVAIAPPSAPIVAAPQPGTIRVNPGAPIRKETPFTLDGKKVLGFSLAPNFDITHSTVSGSVRLNFYEHYGNYGQFFALPNSFFVSYEYLRKFSTDELKSSDGKYINDESGSPIEPNLDVSSSILGLGALYKIRIGDNQRFIANFGLSFLLFIVNTTITADYVGVSGPVNYNPDNTTRLAPGIGASGGFGFRFTPLISMDLGFAWNATFSNIIEGGVETLPNLSHFDKLSYDGMGMMFFSVSLGVSLWFPR